MAWSMYGRLIVVTIKKGLVLGLPRTAVWGPPVVLIHPPQAEHRTAMLTWFQVKKGVVGKAG